MGLAISSRAPKIGGMDSLGTAPRPEDSRPFTLGVAVRPDNEYQSLRLVLSSAGRSSALPPHT